MVICSMWGGGGGGGGGGGEGDNSYLQLSRRFSKGKYNYGGRDTSGLTLTHRVNIPCGRKLEYPERTHAFR